MKTASFIASVFLALIAVVHLLRVLFHVEATVGGRIVPVWMSVIACVFTGALAIMLWLENRRKQ